MVATYGCVAGATTRTAGSTICVGCVPTAAGPVVADACVVATAVVGAALGIVVAAPGGLGGYSLKMRICQPNITAKEINIRVIRRLVSIKSQISNFKSQISHCGSHVTIDRPASACPENCPAPRSP